MREGETASAMSHIANITWFAEPTTNTGVYEDTTARPQEDDRPETFTKESTTNTWEYMSSDAASKDQQRALQDGLGNHHLPARK